MNPVLSIVTVPSSSEQRPVRVVGIGEHHDLAAFAGRHEVERRFVVVEGEAVGHDGRQVDGLGAKQPAHPEQDLGPLSRPSHDGGLGELRIEVAISSVSVGDADIVIAGRAAHISEAVLDLHEEPLCRFCNLRRQGHL